MPSAWFLQIKFFQKNLLKGFNFGVEVLERGLKRFAVIGVGRSFQIREYVLFGEFESLAFAVFFQLILRFLRFFAGGLVGALLFHLGFHVLAFPTACHTPILPHRVGKRPQKTD